MSNRMKVNITRCLIIALTGALMVIIIFYDNATVENSGLFAVGFFIVFLAGVSALIGIDSLYNNLYNDLHIIQPRVEAAERRYTALLQLVKGTLKQEEGVIVEEAMNEYLSKCAQKFLHAAAIRSEEMTKREIEGEGLDPEGLAHQNEMIENRKQRFWDSHAEASAVGIEVRKTVREYIAELPEDGDTSAAKQETA